MLATAVTIPSLTTLNVGVDSQPFDIDFLLNHNAACTVYWGLLGEPSFATLTATTKTSGKVRINGVVASDASTYKMTVQAKVNLSIINTTFSIVIADPCASTTFDSANPISNFAIAITSASTGTTSQPLSIKTAIQVANPTIVCKTIVTMSPIVLGLSLAVDNTAVVADLAAIKSAFPTTIASTQVTLTAES